MFPSIQNGRGPGVSEVDARHRWISQVQIGAPYRRWLAIAGHAILAGFAYFFAFTLRFDEVPEPLVDYFLRSLFLLVVIRMITFGVFRVHEGVWRYVSIRDLVAIFKAVSLSSLIFATALLGIYGFGFPRSIIVLDWLLCFVLVAGVRVVLRIVWETSPARRQEKSRRALIVGAGDAGEWLIREIGRNTALNYSVVGLVDDSLKVQGKRIHGVQVVGTIDSLPQICKQRGVTDVLLAIPSATDEQRGRIMDHCRKSGVVVRTVPSVLDLWTGRAQIGHLQKVAPEDLLGRKKVVVDVDRLRNQVSGQRVMVTGAGGSIGSELCRQLAALKPAVLVAFDQAETNLYWLQLEIQRTHPDVQVIPIVGDILDSHRVHEVMGQHRPVAVYHAAAYKHVPMMEQNALEAIRNNVFGTETVAAAAEANGVARFVLISTDKAVHPISIMGMSKRVAEDLLVSRNISQTAHITVRFGNVLGSAGSVMPLFQWQMVVGGPVTVTDLDATRYFMLIVEAAQLVLQAAAMGRGGEIFMLDMGTPVPVLQLAEDLMRLSGIDPSDISVETVGLRPGEKLREELMHETEQFLASDHEQIFVSIDEELEHDRFQRGLMQLRRAVDNRDEKAARRILREMSQRPALQAASRVAESKT
jgi:FlaA1/EpsC-like NDP-sugar epimerase